MKVDIGTCSLCRRETLVTGEGTTWVCFSCATKAQQILFKSAALLTKRPDAEDERLANLIHE